MNRDDVARAFLARSRELLTSDYLPRVERCLEKLSDAEIWHRPAPDANSVGNLMLHLSGNLRQWVVSGLGGEADARQRQTEFDERGPLPRGEVLARLRATVEEAAEVLSRLPPESLLERRRIQSLDVSVLQAVFHAVEHFSMHTGQIILLTRMMKGALNFYDFSDGTPRTRWHKRNDER
ncbi:MAG TPA: DinB family protein [Pyrinomonadaceae bacterium]|nr:DinB family protein [Pyrinomonadaceae bacterium]